MQPEVKAQAPTGYPRLCQERIPRHDPDAGLNLKYLATEYQMAMDRIRCDKESIEEDF